jgi:hypothetical protein
MKMVTKKKSEEPADQADQANPGNLAENPGNPAESSGQIYPQEGDGETANLASTEESGGQISESVARFDEDDNPEIDAETLSDDLARFVLRFVQENFRTRGWHHVDQPERDYLEDHVRTHCRKIGQAARDAIMAQGRPSLKVKIDGITRKGGLKATVVASPEDENRHELFDADGHHALLVLFDPAEEVAENEREEVVKETMQPDLPLGDPPV